MARIGIGWASLMGTPYIMLANSIPPERTDIYMGVFNMFIVVPMLIESLTLPLLYEPVLGSVPRNVVMLAGAMLLLAALATLRVGRITATPLLAPPRLPRGVSEVNNKPRAKCPVVG